MRSGDKKEFRHYLLRWYEASQRPMPWRETIDPYYIWISEVMLQQTQVATVIGYFNRFVQRFPDIKTLAEADLQDVLKLWEGLGYYSRARNLHQAVNQLVERGVFTVPDTPSEFLSLSGVGPYTCSAVQSIAFGHPLAVVDGNVKRVLSRIYELKIPVNDSSVHDVFNKKADGLLDTSDPSSFNQAMMELGALVCKPTSPLCSTCPVASFCKAFADGHVADFPKRKKKAPVPLRKRVAGLIVVDNTFLIVRRKEDGFLGGLWELPDASLKKNANPEKALAQDIQTRTGLIVDIDKNLARIKHAYTHFKLEMDLFLCRVKKGEVVLNGPIDFKWINPDEIDDFAFHKAVHKCFPMIDAVIQPAGNQP